MPALSSSDIEIIKPLVLPELESTPWKPYGTRYYDGGQSEMAQASNKYSILCQSSLLAEVVNDFTKLLYGSDVQIEDEQLVVRYEEMKRWFHGLPAELDVQNQRLPLPQVITLQ